MQTKEKIELEIAGVGLIMATSILTVILVAWLGDARNDPRDYPNPPPTVAQSE